MLGPSCMSAAHERCEIAFNSAGESAAAFGISRSMMYFGMRILSSVEARQWVMVDTAVACSQLTVGFQSANMPLGLSFHTHAWSPHSWKVSFCLNLWPKSSGGA